MTKEIFTADQLITFIVEGIEDVKGQQITILDLRDIENTVCDYFIICEGTSNTQVKAIADSIQKETLETLEDKPWHKEGTETSEWVLMDYVNVVAHIFQTPVRDFYALEELWGDAKITSIESKN